MLIGLPSSTRYRRAMGFPMEGEVVEGFHVETVSIDHGAASTDELARYECPTTIIVCGEGSVDDVSKAFQAYFVGETTIPSRDGQSYQCVPGTMSVQALDGNKFTIKAVGRCVSVLEDEQPTARSLDLREVALRAFDAIFDDHESVDLDGAVYRIERTPRAKLRFVTIERYTFLEQNPRKVSPWAQLARAGQHILWVLVGRRYVAQVRDGVFHDLRKRSPP